MSEQPPFTYRLNNTDIKMFRVSLVIMCFLASNVIANELPQVDALLLAGKLNINETNYKNAYKQCLSGIEMLGTQYQIKTVVDDTGQKLVIAQKQFEGGDFKIAANNLCNALSSRISMLNSKTSSIVSHSLPQTKLNRTSTAWVGFACSDGYENNNDYAKGFCNGFIEAAYNSIDNWCVPLSITDHDIKKLVVKELIKKRNKMGDGQTKAPTPPAIETIKQVVNEMWPCQN